ncbi:MAG TPA: BamA/TamA family outer membrane protein, partial [Chitinophagaceae bacterium]
VDQKAFAKARIFDMFIGDWGRHPGNWRWAKFENDPGQVNIYKPIPRDRDQAYTMFDGFWPWIATNIAGAIQLETFDHKLNNAKRFNKSAWPLDRPFTNELTEEDWIDAAKELQRELTDPVIESAIHQLPPELFSISGNTIIAKLKSRRDQLQEDAKNYYRFLSHHVELRGSNKREFFEIKRLNKAETQINIYKITKENETEQKPYFSRTFKDEETREIRLYSSGSSDVIKETGTSGGVKVRVIDPEGTDSISLESKARTKISSGKKFRFDTLHTKKFNFFVLPLFSPPEYRVFEYDPVGLFARTGVRVSANMRYLSQPWRTSKYMNTQVLSANYGFLRTSFNIGYVGRFGHLVGPFDLLVKARVDPRAIQNYFGTGNETVEITKQRNFYRTVSTRAYGGLGLSAIIGHHQTFDITGFYQTIKLKDAGGYFTTADHKIDSSLLNTNQFAGVEAVYHYRKTNHDIYPTRGIDFLLAGTYVQNIKQSNRSFNNVASSFAFYIPVSKSLTFASRAGGAALNGDADFYHLNRLDATLNLRGYIRERFTGKTMFYNNNELRWVTNTKNYFFNGQAGLFVFYDQGRIWQPLEVSNKWHTGYGAGVILIPFNRAALTGTYTRSVEGSFIQLKAVTFF